MWSEKALLVSFLLGFVWSVVHGHGQCEVKLKYGYGDVHGRGLLSKTPKGDPLCSFLGIPYAQPPIGVLRFEPPQPLDLAYYSSSFDFTVKSPICVQNMLLHNGTSGQEDCLYLNVYKKQSHWTELKPVIVWLHGGWFQTGSAYSRNADQPDYLVDEDIIFVTLNYRLGALGFLFRNKDTFTGNLGLRDQVEALKWVRANIAAFGGNPQKITLMGWSAGSASVAYHLQAPASRGLFQAAIMMSGTSFNPWAYERHTQGCVNVLCKTLNIPCAHGDLKEILKRIPTSYFKSIALNSQTVISYLGEPAPCFEPTVELQEVAYGTAMVQDLQQRLISQPILNDVPLMIGHTVAETWPSFHTNRFSLQNSWNYSFTNTRDDVLSSLRRYLIAGTKELNNLSKQLMTEAILLHGIRDFAEYYTTNADSNIFFYRFSHKQRGNDIGSFHGDELPYIFGQPDGPTGKSKTSQNHEDGLIRMRLVRYITDFAKFG
ncbi:esterase E4-like [Lutzomyia longipalpis]|uniref:esterase E4-like n=1 Tax=Lutzomyia longipalpis TaxID=7200 RepID=UPI0024840715|nr:esterase E4-like [Lutzomyia longipalpis]